MKFVLTRRNVDNLDLRAVLVSELGLSEADFILAPLSEIILKEARLDRAAEYDALLATSAHGLVAVSGWPESLKSKLFALPLYCVGEKTRDAYLRSGGACTAHSSVDVSELISYLKGRDPARLLYLRGEHVRHDLKSSLEAHGHQVSECTIYEARLCEALPVEVLDTVRAAEPYAVLFYSKRTADHFFALMNEKDYADCLNLCTFICLSDVIAQSVRDAYPSAKCLIAPSPNHQGMLTILKTLCA